MSTTHVPPRACGERQQSGIYATVGTSEKGTAIESFLLCPPILLDAGALGLSAIGTKLIEQNGQWHVLDIVGAEFYPNAADFLEEARRQGVSRRIAKTTDFSLLRPGARLLIAHPRGHIVNSHDYHRLRPDDEFWCPRDVWEHTAPPRANGELGMCSSLLWECVTGGVPASDPEAPGGMLCGDLMSDITGAHFHRRRNEPRAIVRTLPSFSYRAFRSPQEIEPVFVLALVASFPLGRLEVVRDRAGDSHLAAMEKASASGLPVSLEDE